MGKKMLFLVFLLVFAGIAAAANSTINLAVQDSQLTVTRVFDDDGSIEKLDVFVANSTGTQRYSFDNVSEGAVLNVPFTDSSTTAYNFTDTDGTTTGLGTFIIVQTGQGYMGKAPVRQPGIKVIRSFSIKPRMAPGNSAYYIDMSVDMNNSHELQSLTINYKLNGGTLSTFTNLVFDGSRYTGSLGPFDKNVYFSGYARAIDTQAKEYRYTATKSFVFMLPAGTSCEIGEPVSAQTSANDNSGEGFWEEQNAFFADITGFSYMKATRDASGNLKASYVFDDDARIERVDVFYRIGNDVTQRTYTNVAVNQSLGNVPSTAEMAWFNYFDFDGSVSNISVMNQFEEPEEIIPPPDNQHAPKPKYMGNYSVSGVPSADGKTFSIVASVEKGTDTATAVDFVYRIDSGPVRTTHLDASGTYYTGNAGSFDGSFELKPSPVFIANGALGKQYAYPPSYWFALIPKEQIKCVEICGDGIDNDDNGKIEDGCVLRTELFFLNKNVPLYSLKGQPIMADVTVKNSGVINAPAFETEFYINDKLVSVQLLPFLNAGESEKVFFEVPYSAEYEGENEVKVVIDPHNNVPELQENNNTYLQSMIVGPNFFDVSLNFNDSYFPADYRIAQVKDAQGRNVEGADVKIGFPSGETTTFISDAQGLVEFRLPSSGTYSVSATKEEYTPFSGLFEISPLRIPGLNDIVTIGSTQVLYVENLENRRLTSGFLEIETPSGNTETFDLNKASTIEFQAAAQGKYALKVVRNQIVVFQSEFLATGIVESILFSSNFVELLFGSIIREPLTFLFLIVLCALSAYLGYSKSMVLFRRGAKGTREKQIETAIRIGIGVAYFILPFQVNRFLGFNASLLFVFLEVIVMLAIDYYTKQLLQKRKAIKV